MSRKLTGPIVVLLSVLLVCVFSTYHIPRIINLLWVSAFWLLPLLGLLIGATLAYFSDSAKTGLRLFGVLLAAISLAGGIYLIATHSYSVNRAYFKHVVITDETAPTFEERAAFRVAEAQAPGNLGSISGLLEETTYLPAEDRFTSLVARPGNLQGYSAVLTQKVALTGQATPTTCNFDTDRAQKRFGALFGHSLARAISHEKRGLRIHSEDVYSYCDGDTPYVVAPATRLTGLFPAIDVPAGVAVYNGATDEIQYMENVSAGSLPGPVFPISLAENLRESASASGGYWDYVRGRVGYSTTSNDESDTNAGNAAEFALSANGTPTYATALSPRIRATSIAALGVVEADVFESGKFPVYTVHTLDPTRKSNSDVADRLRADYGALPEWAAGMDIFEITPVSEKEWVASLGREKNIIYRVRINVDGSSCLETAEGEKIRCSGDAAPENNTSTEFDGNVATLTDAELFALTQAVNAEIQSRFAKN